jgi:mRNA interferase RelE/StbE
LGAEGRLTLRYHPKVVKEDIPRLDGANRRRIKNAIEKKLTLAPEQFAKPLAYTRASLWSLRVGSWRVIFALREDRVWILKIGHRRDVYDRLDREVPLASS